VISGKYCRDSADLRSVAFLVILQEILPRFCINLRDQREILPRFGRFAQRCFPGDSAGDTAAILRKSA